MSESTRKKVIAGILVVVAIWGYQNLKPQSDDKPPPQKQATPTVQNQAPKPAKTAAPKLVNVEQKIREPWGSDPFRVVKTRRQPGQKDSTVKWIVSGILYNDHSPTAIINKKPVKQGDVINGARVVDIDKKSVILEYNGNKMTVTVTKG